MDCKAEENKGEFRYYTHLSFNTKHMSKRIRKAKFLNEVQKTQNVDEALRKSNVKRPALAQWLLEDDFQTRMQEIAPTLTACAIGRIVDICTGEDTHYGTGDRLKAADRLLDIFGKEVTGREFNTAIKRQELANQGQKESILAMINGAVGEKALELAKKKDVFLLDSEEAEIIDVNTGNE